jgi:uncharacterized Zn finger protein (UPF0148 family)
MADLLRSGNTMLNMACPVCNNPIFRNRDGNTFCPTCNRNVLIVKDETYEGSTIKKSEPYHKEQMNILHSKKTELLNSLQEIMLEKIEIITKKLENETNSQVIETYTEILLNCLEILNKIQSNSMEKNEC